MIIYPPCRGDVSSAEFLHHVVGDFVIAPDGLDVVVVVEHVEQPEQRRGVPFVNLDPRLRAPGELVAFGFAEHRFERARALGERFLRGPVLDTGKTAWWERGCVA